MNFQFIVSLLAFLFTIIFLIILIARDGDDILKIISFILLSLGRVYLYFEGYIINGVSFRKCSILGYEFRVETKI